MDRNFDTQSGPIEKQSVVSGSRNALSPIDFSEYVAKYITKKIKKTYIYIFSMLHVCWKIIKLYNKLTHPLRAGYFYILLRTNKLRI